MEATVWKTATDVRRDMLCPVLARLPFELCVVMPRAQPYPKKTAKN